jgi:radical SAM protein with 4Fe4S-binding SPASM domain
MKESTKNLARQVFTAVVPMGIQRRARPYARFALSLAERTITHPFSDKPVAVELETNSNCTRSCFYCPRLDEDYVLETEVFESVVDQLAEWGFRGRFSPHSYNEPLTDERLPALIKYASQKLPKSDIVLYTNGDLLTGEMTERLIESGVDNIIVSLHDPASPELEGRLNALNSQYSAIRFIDRRAGKRDIAFVNRGGLVNLGEIEPMPYCSFIDTMVIRADGNVILCCSDTQKQHVFGNVNHESVKDIWEEPEFKALRKDIRAGRYDLPICQECGYEIL